MKIGLAKGSKISETYKTMFLYYNPCHQKYGLLYLIISAVFFRRKRESTGRTEHDISLNCVMKALQTEQLKMTRLLKNKAEVQRPSLPIPISFGSGRRNSTENQHKFLIFK